MSRTFTIYDHNSIHTIVVDTDKQLTVRDLIKKYGEKIGVIEPWIDLMTLDEQPPFVGDSVPEILNFMKLFLDIHTPIENIKCDKLQVVCGSDY